MDQGSVSVAAGVVRPSAVDLLQLLEQIYPSTLLPEAWSRILCTIAPRFGSAKGLLTIIDAIQPSASESHVVGLAAEVAAAFARRDLAGDLLFSACRRLPPETVAIGSELVDRQRILSAPQWGPFQDAGLEYQLIAVLENRADTCAILGLARGDRDFTTAEQTMLQQLVTHLRTALHITRRLQRVESGRRDVIRFFDRAQQPIVVLDRSGYALYVNSSAAALLEPANGLSLRLGRFLFSSVTTQRRFETAVRRALVQSEAVTETPLRIDILVERFNGQPPLEMAVIAVHRPADRTLMPEGAGCMVLLTDPAMPQSVATARLTHLYGLTIAEARVCEALLATGSARGVAERLHITGNTVRSHLKRIYEKVGVGNQAQLLQRLTVLGTRPATLADIVGVSLASGA